MSIRIGNKIVNQAIASIPSGGSVNNQDKTITSNGVYTADEGYSGLGTVTVTVENNKTKFGMTIDDFVGDLSSNGQYSVKTTKDVDVSFDGLTSFAKNSGVMTYLFSSQQCIRSVTFPDLASFGQYGSFSYLFYYSKVVSASFPVLGATGELGCRYMFYGSSSLTSVSFPSLVSVGSSGFEYGFYGCSSLQTLTFDSLSSIDINGFNNAFQGSGVTTINFPNIISNASLNANCLVNMMSNTGTSKVRTIHFPSNKESKIETLNGYPLFGGEADYVVIAFDLPATS